MACSYLQSDTRRLPSGKRRSEAHELHHQNIFSSVARRSALSCRAVFLAGAVWRRLGCYLIHDAAYAQEPGDLDMSDSLQSRPAPRPASAHASAYDTKCPIKYQLLHLYTYKLDGLDAAEHPNQKGVSPR